MKAKTLICVLAVMGLAACTTGRGVHSIPVSRDYKNLERVTVKDARPVVEKAHRVGAHVYAPYETASAARYLKQAKEERAENDCKGEKDFSALAIKMGNEAIAKGSGIPDKGPMVMPVDQAACKVEFDRLVAKFKQLNRCKAILVAPIQYAHIEAELSAAEHELMERWFHWEEAARYMAPVEADIDAIAAHDIDGDGVKDLADGDPWVAEDKDGFQDEDGIPEPPPYPVLSPIHFDTAKAVLRAEDKGYLKGIANMMNSGYKEATLYVAGHTDTKSTDKYNEDLSKRRAEATQKYLEKQGVSAAQLSVSFHGESKPITDNGTAEGRAQNRRVELKLDSPDVVSKYCTPASK